MKTALVTGASSGIGKAIASALLKEGMTVIGLCRSVDQLPDGVKPLACDLRDESAIKAAFETLEELDILVNSAGLAYLSRICDGKPFRLGRDVASQRARARTLQPTFACPFS